MSALTEKPVDRNRVCSSAAGNRGLEWIDWVNSVSVKPYEVRNGHVVIPNGPGLGLDWDEDLVRSASVGR